MAITKNSIIYYKDLIDASKEMIKNIAQNIGSYTGNIPATSTGRLPTKYKTTVNTALEAKSKVEAEGLLNG